MERNLKIKFIFLFGIIFLCLSWSQIRFYDLTNQFLIVPLFFLLGIYLLNFGILFYAQEKRNIIGLSSFILSIIAISLFFMIYWLLETRDFWKYFNHSMLLFFSLIFLSVLVLAIITGLVSIRTFDRKNKFGLTGLLFSFVSVLLVFVLVLLPAFTLIDGRPPKSEDASVSGQGGEGYIELVLSKAGQNYPSAGYLAADVFIYINSTAADKTYLTTWQAAQSIFIKTSTGTAFGVEGGAFVNPMGAGKYWVTVSIKGTAVYNGEITVS